MPPRLFLCSALVCLQEGMGVCCNTLALLLSKQLLSSFSSWCYYVLLNLLVREFPGFVGNTLPRSPLTRNLEMVVPCLSYY